MSFSRLTSGFLSRVVSQGSTLILLVLGAQFLTPAEFGAYTLASIAVALANVFLFSGAYEHVLKSADLDRDGPLALSTQLLTAVLASVTLGCSGWLLKPHEATESLGLMLQLFSVIPLLAATAAWREAVFLRAPDKLPAYFQIILWRDLAALALGAGLLFLGLGLWAMVAYRMALAALGYAAFHLAHPSLCPISRRLSDIKSLLIKSMPLTGSRLLSFFGSNGMDVVVGVFLSPAAVGIYRMASRLVLAAYDIVAQPMMKHAWVHMADETRKGLTGHQSLRKAQGLSMILLAVACTYLTVSREDLVQLVLGPQWSPVVHLIPMFAAAALFTALGQFVEPVLSLRNKGVELFRLRLCVTLLLMGSVACGAQLWQLEGAAYAKLLGSALAAAVLWWGMLRWGGVRRAIAWEAFALAVGTSLACLVVGLGLNSLPLDAMWRLMLQALSMGALGALFIWLFQRHQAGTADDKHVSGSKP
ncbi:MAG: oligosaccharide flippase family protein [Rubrivivax sp.]|jgi:O-antigen/teichoic acid export membrane protein|nr:oligosaccharide flippase family protein [Rubrivivax sp.]